MKIIKAAWKKYEIASKIAVYIPIKCLQILFRMQVCVNVCIIVYTYIHSIQHLTQSCNLYCMYFY